jgi:N-acetylglucosamine-6-phosphate deacetylase
MGTTLFKNVKIVLEDTILTGSDLLVCDDTISKIAAGENTQADKVINGGGNYLCPGFIDLHIHGTHQYLIDNGIDDLENICQILPRYGVTGFLPTVCPLPKGRDAEFLAGLSRITSKGAKICGFHLEGPFLTLTGALPPEAIGTADVERVKALIAAAGPYKAVFSIAPDFEGINDLIPVMAQNNTPVFITHTKADVSQTEKAIKSGACHATHFYDVFYAPDESDPGVRPCGAVEVILADKDVSVDFILDGEHVSPAAVKMALNCKGSDKVCLITDANIGAGSEPGVYMFGKEKVNFKYPGAPARFVKNNSLAGSGLTMNKAVRNAVEMLPIELPMAVRMASTNPARVLRLGDTGSIRPGSKADLVLMNDKFEVIQTWINGQSCYKA